MLVTYCFNSHFIYDWFLVIFYESHSVIHGRPFPLKGRYYAVSCKRAVFFCIFNIDIVVCIDLKQTFHNTCSRVPTFPQNVFVHFEPLGHTLKYEEENAEDEESLQNLYQKAWKKLQTKCSDDEDCKARVDLNVENQVPHYIVPGSEEERRWLQTHPKAKAVSCPFISFNHSYNSIHDVSH